MDIVRDQGRAGQLNALLRAQQDLYATVALGDDSQDLCICAGTRAEHEGGELREDLPWNVRGRIERCPRFEHVWTATVQDISDRGYA